MKTTTCSYCEGTGKTIDREATGKEMRLKRLRLRISAAKVAERLGVTRSYIALLEFGHKNWSPEMLERYEKVLEESKSELLNDIG